MERETEDSAKNAPPPMPEGYDCVKTKKQQQGCPVLPGVGGVHFTKSIRTSIVYYVLYLEKD